MTVLAGFLSAYVSATRTVSHTTSHVLVYAASFTRDIAASWYHHRDEMTGVLATLKDVVDADRFVYALRDTVSR